MSILTRIGPLLQNRPQNQPSMPSQHYPFDTQYRYADLSRSGIHAWKTKHPFQDTSPANDQLPQPRFRWLTIRMTTAHRITRTSLQQGVRKLIPSLTGDLYKGECGRIGVVGGCKEYTGAPYFSAYSALRLGADLSHVFCSASASSVIKSYSPELIVHPYLYEQDDVPNDQDMGRHFNAFAEKACTDVSNWFTRLDCLVVGPGLGRDPLNLQCTRLIMKAARDANLPMVIDADGLYIVTQYPDLIQDYPLAILTPNINELRRLARIFTIPHDDLNTSDLDARVRITEGVGRGLNGPVLVSKGAQDVISNGVFVANCDVLSSNRRCGGQGDVLSGSMAVFVSWGLRQGRSAVEKGDVLPLIFASYGGCCVARTAASLAFRKKERSMIAGDLIGFLGNALKEIE